MTYTSADWIGQINRTLGEHEHRLDAGARVHERLVQRLAALEATVDALTARLAALERAARDGDGEKPQERKEMERVRGGGVG